MNGSVLERNLQALAKKSPAAARLVAQAPPLEGAEFFRADDGALYASIPTAAGGRVSLASRRQPIEEARRLAETVAIEEAGCVVVLGFGLGHHVKAMADCMKRTGIILCFEPDVSLLRSVFQHVDHSAWLAEANVAILTDADDAGQLSAVLRGSETIVGLGAKILEHPASRTRLGEAGARFGRTFTDIIRTIRTSMVTTMVQVETTIENLLMNLDHYATDGGVADLADRCAGRPAIVVSAGPSLARNIDLLARPGVRDRFVIIAVQTVLKTLLDRGIKPHFVTALDYHEISRRFYEGLTPGDVSGVTLVAEPKANPAILDAFPGDVRVVGNDVLDRLLGDELAGEHGTLPAGATVSHLAYYLARHLGCDPVVLMGQDLGFTDGQYYAAGAAIHNVWAGELGPMNTLETLEWQRIARSRKTLVRKADTLGRSVYTDEQMATYLVQFERDFMADTGRGLRIIDATEGGVAKQNTEVMPLACAIETFGSLGGHEPIDRLLPGLDLGRDRASRLIAARDRVREVRKGVCEVGEASREALVIVREMLEHHGNQSRVNRLIRKVDAVRDRALAIEPAFTLVQHLNQTGTFRRVRADRSIKLAESLSPLEAQRRSIERDISNLQWLGDAADRMGELLGDAARVLGGGEVKESAAPSPVSAAGQRELKVAAVIAVDPDVGTLGNGRALERPLFDGKNPLELTLARLARSQRVGTVYLIAEDVDRVGRLAGRAPAGLRLEVVRAAGAIRDARVHGVAQSRLLNPAAWRGGAGGLCVYDEVCPPGPILDVMQQHDLEAAVLLGADWALIDPGLTDAVVSRFSELSGENRRTFTQAPPGLAPCCVSRGLMGQLVELAERAWVFASLGATLSYIPVSPARDPIAEPVCIHVDPTIRDIGVRCIPDSIHRAAVIGALLTRLGPDALGADAAAVARALQQHEIAGPARHVTLDLGTEPAAAGLRGVWFGAGVEPSMVFRDAAARLFEVMAESHDDAVLTLAGRGDPLDHPEVFEIIQDARALGVAAVHLRTDLTCDPGLLDRIVKSPLGVVSVDLLAHTSQTYRRITGRDSFGVARSNLLALIERLGPISVRSPWIVPRITRCDAVYEEIEPFYDEWLMRAGSAVIDPLPRVMPGERIEPLPLPPRAAWTREHAAITADSLPDALVALGGAFQGSGV